MKQITRVNLKDFIRNTRGKIFSIVFIKKNGEERYMVARTGVKKGIKGVGQKIKDPLIQLYINVFDMKKNDWRKINLKTVKKIKFKGEEYEIID